MALLNDSTESKQFLRDSGFKLYQVSYLDGNFKHRTQLIPYPSDQTIIACENFFRTNFHFIRIKGIYDIDVYDSVTLQTPEHIRGMLTISNQQIPIDHYFVLNKQGVKDMYALQNGNVDIFMAKDAKGF